MDPANLQNQRLDQQDKPIPFDSKTPSQVPVSRQPITVGARPAPVQQPARPASVQTASVADRIIGMKTFFAKLHPGSLTFLEEQVAAWLKEHPAVKIKTTNVTVGEVQGKVTEPNLIVVVWY